jgi:hypothetical protein
LGLLLSGLAKITFIKTPAFINRRARAGLATPLCILLLCAINFLFARKLFRVEFSDRLGSIEGTFIAIARQLVAHPRDLIWWPFWDTGMPFQNTYLPLLHMIVAAWSALSHYSPARSYHQISAIFFILGPVTVFLMAKVLSGRTASSFLSAFVYSVISPGALLLRPVAHAMGGALHLRRLEAFVDYGEGPATAALTLLPVALLFLYLALCRKGVLMKILAATFMGLTVLANAFGATLLAMGAVSLLVAGGRRGIVRRAAWTVLLALLAYCWISPLCPPSVVSAIRANSPTVEGDYRFNEWSAAGWAILAVCFGATVWTFQKLNAPHYLRFFALFTVLLSGVVCLGYFYSIYLLPQFNRYQNAMDIALSLFLVFGVRQLLQLRGEAWLKVGFVIGFLAAALMVYPQMRYARGLIQSVDIKSTGLWRNAKWMDDHMNGRRVMMAGGNSFFFNVFTDTPQMHGGHDPMLPNSLVRGVMFQIFSGMNAKNEGEVAVLWLRAYGVRAITVSGPGSDEFYKPFANPAKFDGLLPVLRRDRGDTIYGVPTHSDSLAHVIPKVSLVRDVPVHGLDVSQVSAYVDAMENNAAGAASLDWRSRHSARLTAKVPQGDVVSVQMTYAKGWRASIAGTPQQIREDGLGFLVIEPDRSGLLIIDLVYDGGRELLITRLLSGSVMAATLLILTMAFARSRSPVQRGRGTAPSPDE